MVTFIDEPMGTHWSKRLVAYIIDSIVVFFISILIIIPFMAVGANILLDLTFIFVFGIISIIYFGLLEGAAKATLGKMTSGLKVYDTVSGYGATGGQAFARSLTKFNPLVVLLADLLPKGAMEGDPRQKLFDKGWDTIVVSRDYVDYEEVEEYVPPPIEPKRETETVHLKVGDIYTRHCSNCGTPYRMIVNKDGELKLMGPWENRCTWCNHYVSVALEGSEEDMLGSPDFY